MVRAVQAGGWGVGWVRAARDDCVAPSLVTFPVQLERRCTVGGAGAAGGGVEHGAGKNRRREIYITASILERQQWIAVTHWAVPRLARPSSAMPSVAKACLA